MSSIKKLSDQQYEIISALWMLGEGSAREVQGLLTSKKLAHTTVATILTRLEDKGLLKSHSRGRERVYVPLISKTEVRKNMVGAMVGTLFAGNPKELLVHLVKEGEVNPDELAEIGKLIESADDDS